jgi:chorismate mutase
MHEVARWKWNEGKPILDAERERESLEAVVQRGRARGLDPGIVHAFFAAQMAAARQVQQADFDRWREEGRGALDGAERLAVLRQRIDVLNGELLEALVTAAPLLGGPAFQEALPARAAEILDRDGLSAVRETAISPLRVVR